MWNPALTNNLSPVPSLRGLLVNFLDQLVDRSNGKLEPLTFFGLCDAIGLLKDPGSHPFVNAERMGFRLVCETRSAPRGMGKRLEIRSDYPVVEFFLTDLARNLPPRLLIEAKLGDQAGMEWFHETNMAMLDLHEFMRDMGDGCTIVAV